MIPISQKLPRTSKFLMTVLVAFGLCQSAMANGSREKALVVADVDLPFAPAIVEKVQMPAPVEEASAVASPSPVIGGSMVSKVLPVAKVEVPVSLVSAPTTVNLNPGKTVSEQLGAMGLAAGWHLVWDAPDFTIEQAVPVSSDFILAVSALIESASSNGANLKATFYRGNNTVRVTEF